MVAFNPKTALLKKIIRFSTLPQKLYFTIMSDTESDIEDIPHDEVVKKLKVPEFDESPTSSGGELLFERIYIALLNAL